MTVPDQQGLVTLVSTVSDSVENLQRFVRRNLEAGADRLFVFLDRPDREVEDVLAGHPQVVLTVCDDTYWLGARPVSLQRRQVINANLVQVALTLLPRVQWLFNLDSDEALHLDRDRLLGLSPEVSSVELATLEVVSQERWDTEPTYFKRALDKDELNLLAMLGAIPTPDMNGYFRGHRHKAGHRPTLDRRIRLHRADTDTGEPVPRHTADWLRVLHYDSTTAEEFVRKWTSHLTSGVRGHRPHRDRLRSAAGALIGNDALSEERKRELLLQLYRDHVRDDLDLLRELGFLVEVPPGVRRDPAPFDTAEERALGAVWPILLRADKRYFALQSALSFDDLLSDLHAQLRGVDAAAADRLGDAMRRAGMTPPRSRRFLR